MAMGRVFADDAMLLRITRAESHLTREADKTLTMLARLQAIRVAEWDITPSNGAIGFVLPNGAPDDGEVASSAREADPDALTAQRAG